MRYVDGAVQNPYELRARALAAPYRNVTVPGDATYKRVWVGRIPELDAAVQDSYPEPLHTVGTAFRLNYQGEMPNNYVHSDIGYGDVAAVLYLSLPEHCEGGTAFWRHKGTGSRILVPGTEQDFVKADAWEQYACVQMKFNRLLVYPTTLFHSRWPWAAFGDNFTNGRLIAVGFYKTQRGT